MELPLIFIMAVFDLGCDSPASWLIYLFVYAFISCLLQQHHGHFANQLHPSPTNSATRPALYAPTALNVAYTPNANIAIPSSGFTKRIRSQPPPPPPPPPPLPVLGLPPHPQVTKVPQGRMPVHVGVLRNLAPEVSICPTSTPTSCHHV